MDVKKVESCVGSEPAILSADLAAPRGQRAERPTRIHGLQKYLRQPLRGQQHAGP